MDIKIINHEKNAIHFSIDNLPYILKKRKEFADLFKTTGVLILENNEPKHDFNIQSVGSIIFEFCSDPKKTIINFFNTVRIYSQEDIENELLEILKRGICISENMNSTTFINHSKFGLQSNINYRENSIILPRNKDINKILRRKVTFIGGQILEQNEIRINSIQLSSTHEKLDMMDSNIFNEKVDKLLKKMKIG